MFSSLKPLFGRNGRDGPRPGGVGKKNVKSTETSSADTHMDGSWGNSLSPVKLAAAAFAGIGAYAALAPHLQGKGEGLMHLEHGIECIIDGLTGYKTALAKRKRGDSSGTQLSPAKKVVTEVERDTLGTHGAQRSGSCLVQTTAIEVLSDEGQRLTSHKGNLEEQNQVIVNALEIIDYPTKTEEIYNRSLYKVRVIDNSDTDEAVARTQPLSSHDHGTRFASKALRSANKDIDTKKDELEEAEEVVEPAEYDKGSNSEKLIKQKRWYPNKEQLRRLEFYYKHSRSSFKDREGRTQILAELSKHGETKGQAKLHTWSMNRRAKEKRQAAQEELAKIIDETRVSVPQQQAVKTPSEGDGAIAEYSNPEACRVCGIDDDDGMYCEKCNGVYHFACLGLDAPPTDDYICPSCQ